MKQVEFYFDYGSPFAYLGSTQIEALAQRCDAQLLWQPILLGGLFKEVGTVNVPMFSFSPPKQQHYLKDMVRWADHWNVPFEFPSSFPVRTVDPLRLTLVAMNEAPERMPALLHGLFKAMWAENRDISEASVVREVVQETGADESWLERISEPEIKAQLFEGTSKAAERGVFGVPTCIVGDALFWGQDRLDFVERALTR